MKEFEYLAPKSVEEACSLLGRYQGESKIIAGGQSLMVLLRQRLLAPAYLIDIKGISGLDTIRLDPGESRLRIGALSTHRAVEKSPLIRERLGVLAEMERRLASLQIRNWGTLGGNLCHAEPAADPGPVLCALGAGARLASSRGERSLPLEEFFVDYYQTAMAEDEMLVEVEVPALSGRTGVVYEKFSHRETDMAVVGVAARVELDGKACRDIRIFLGAVGSTPLRAREAEKVLAGGKGDEASIREAAQRAAQEARPVSDLHGTEWYKREIVKAMVRRVVQEAWKKANG